MPGHYKNYDDNLLVELIARGDMTYKAIGQQIGLTAPMVCRVARGERRPELQPRIKAAVEDNFSRVRRLGAKSLLSLVARHVADGLDPKADPAHARRCREFTINKFLADGPAKPPKASGPPTPGLTREDYEAIAKLKGGPDDESDRQTQDQT